MERCLLILAAKSLPFDEAGRLIAVRRREIAQEFGGTGGLSVGTPCGPGPRMFLRLEHITATRRLERAIPGLRQTCDASLGHGEIKE